MSIADLAQQLYPLDGPGMPPAGPDFRRAAEARLGGWGQEDEDPMKALDAELAELYLRALYETQFHLPVVTPPAGLVKRAQCVPGHLWGQKVAGGPAPSEVMIVGKFPGRDELKQRRNLIGPSGQLLLGALRSLGIKNQVLAKWYLTNLVKFAPPSDVKQLPVGWIKDCLPLLHQELRLVRPRFVLCLGADASQALLGAKKYNVDYMEGRVIPLELPLPDGQVHTALVMTCVHPAAVLREPELARRMEYALSRFWQLTRGIRFDQEELDVDHRLIENLSDLERLVAEIDRDCLDNIVAMDAEWHGEHPCNRGSYLRTVQLSWAPKKAACVILRKEGGAEHFQPAPSAAIACLRKALAHRRIAGHFFTADLEWLVAAGLDLRPQFRAPATWQETTQAGGFDTGMAAHAIEETADFKLESLAIRFTTAPRYDTALHEWRRRYCLDHKLKAKDLEGYGYCPEEILCGQRQEPLPDKPGTPVKHSYACLHRDSVVQLGDGRWEKIGKLVKERYSGTVKAFKNGRVINARVASWHRADVGQREWFRLRTASTPEGRWGLLGPLLTPDHRVVTARGKVPVCELMAGQDAILTDEVQFSSQQLSVFLGSGLGDGGFVHQNGKKVGFGFGQKLSRGDYADWKAQVFENYSPSRINTKCRRYVLPFSRYLRWLSDKFPSHPVTKIRTRKLIITAEVLRHLGDLGLAVWYQDDGSLVRGWGGHTSRIYCRRISEGEQLILLTWLEQKFGKGASYNKKGGFVQFSGAAFQAFQKTVRPWIHPQFAYKSVHPIAGQPRSIAEGKQPFYETVLEVRRWQPVNRSGNGVRYCLTVPESGNFLTQVGFVSNCFDADVCRRLVEVQQGLLDHDLAGHQCREAFWISMRAQPAVLEINCTGLYLDRARVDRLTATYMRSQLELEHEICQWANWSSLNLGSLPQVREFLYGEKYNGTKDKQGKPRRLRPAGAKSLYLQPILDTSKRPVRWEEIRNRGNEEEHTAGTGKLVLAILSQDASAVPVRDEQGQILKDAAGKPQTADYGPIVQRLRDYRFISQVLISSLRKPLRGPDGKVLRENGFCVYADGLAGARCADGRVRTHIYPTKETGRWSSTRPALQNLSKRREKDYRRILGERYSDPLRSVIRAAPGKVLVEADYIGAELFGMAIMSGDAAMIEHCRRNQLPEDDPQFYDIHSNVCVLAFQLDCPPTKQGLKAIGKVELRDVAKTVLFGRAYGRGANAIALGLREEGMRTTVEEAEALILALDQLYPQLSQFFEACQERALEERFIRGAFGRLRRFPRAMDDQAAGDLGRQAMNFPIQNLIADAVNRAADHLIEYRKDPGCGADYRIALQMHDALILETPPEHALRVMRHVLPECMSRRVPIYRTDLDGKRLENAPYYLGVDVAACVNWGLKLTAQDCQRLGLDPQDFGVKA